jgi:hypothetical protein
MDKDMKMTRELRQLIEFAEDYILDCFLETGEVTEEHESVLWSCIKIREGNRGRVKLYEYLKGRLQGLDLEPIEFFNQVTLLKAEFGYKNNE